MQTKSYATLFLILLLLPMLCSCAAYFTADTAQYKGRVGATMPQDTLIFNNR